LNLQPSTVNPPDAIDSISVILPAHNEAGNLELVVRRALEVLPTVAAEFEIVVVDDGSRDDTGAIADRLSKDDSRVIVIHHPKNRGYGCAWRTGIAASHGRWIFFMDSDRQFDIGEIAKLTSRAEDYDIITGYRIARRDPYYRFLIGSCFNILVKALFDLHLRDIDCGFKMFRSSLLKPMLLDSPGALINTEIHAKAKMAGARLFEIGITHYPRSIGRQSGTKPKVILRAAGEIVMLRWHLRSYTVAPVIESMKAQARAPGNSKLPAPSS